MRYLWITPFLLALISLQTLSGFAGDHCTESAAGINLAGAEFGKSIPGREGYDYFFPSGAQIAYYKKIGFHSIRLPIMWERLQPKLNGDLDQQYLAGIISVLKSAAGNDMTVIIDLHNYARYRGKVIGSGEVPSGAFVDVWKKIAGAVKSNRALDGYGLINEPYDTKGSWPQIAQAGVDAIRSVDSSHHIFVSVENSGDSRVWQSNFAPFIKDPANLEVYEAHAYFDADYSGRYDSTSPRKDPKSLVDESLNPFIAWLAKYGKKGVVGEWGVPSNDERWFGVVDRMVELSRANCLPIYYWAGGNWGPDYKLSIEPQGSSERILAKHFKFVLGGS